MKENRSKKIDARFTQEEYNAVLALEKQLGIRKSELVRLRLLNDAPIIAVNAKELISRLDAIGAELGRSGNNINQLTRYANILNNNGVLSPQVVERFNLLFERYIEGQQALESSLRKILRCIGK